MLSSSLIFLVISTGTKTHLALKMHGQSCLPLFPLSQSADPQHPSISNMEHAQFPAAIRSAPLWGPNYHPGISLFNLSPFISCSCLFVCLFLISHSLPVNATLIHSFSHSFYIYIFFSFFYFQFYSFIFSCNFSSLFCLLLSRPPCFLSYRSLSFPSFCLNSFSVKSFSPSSLYVFYFIVFHACLSINSDIVDCFSHSMVEGAWQVLPKCSLRVDFLQIENS